MQSLSQTKLTVKQRVVTTDQNSFHTAKNRLESKPSLEFQSALFKPDLSDFIFEFKDDIGLDYQGKNNDKDKEEEKEENLETD